MWEVIWGDSAIHVVPVADTMIHTITMYCSCNPQVVTEDDEGVPLIKNIQVHNAKDNRELFSELRRRGIKGL